MTMRAFVLAGAASLTLFGAAQAFAQQTTTPPADAAVAPIALNSLSSPPDKIASAAVVDNKGTVVGAVQKVDLDQNGKPTRVEIALLGSQRVVALGSEQLSYDQPNNVVTAGLDKTQIAQLPPAG